MNFFSVIVYRARTDQVTSRSGQNSFNIEEKFEQEDMNFQAAQTAVTKLQELKKENIDSKPQSLHSRSTETLAQKRLPGLKMDMTNRKLSQQAEPEGSTVDTMKSQSWINTSAADTSVQCKANRICHWSPMPSLKS